MTTQLTTFPGNRERWISRINTHSEIDTSKYSEDEKLVFALLEGVDFECWKYGDAPEDGTTEEMVKQWLKENNKIISAMHIEPPSYVGLFAGALNFLRE